MRVGNNVHIGKNCVIGHRSIIKDNCKILDGSVLPPDTVVPPFTVFGGRPATFIGELPESYDKIQTELAISFYKNFRPQTMALPANASMIGASSSRGAPLDTSMNSSFSQPQNTRRVLAEQEKEQ